MKLFARTGGYWLFWVSAVYLVLGMIDLFVVKFVQEPWLQVAYVLLLSLPLWIPPLARYFNMKCIWEI